jgi:two-component system, NtrC family, response regulator AtoC
VNARKVLIVDDEKEMCELVEQALEPAGYTVSSCQSGEAALDLLRETEFDVLLSDNQMLGITGVELCQKAMAQQPNLCVIIFTGFGNMDVAVEALRAGAYDFITKPVALEVLVLTIERAMRHQELRHQLDRLHSEPEAPRSGILGNSAPMRKVLDVVKRIAQSDTTLLIQGETGTGKELVAHALHDQSKRSGRFIAINCSAMPENLLESELFGHLPGAFTEARTARTGLLVDANGGTLFLDEIGEMPLGMQAKLLRALQEKTVRPLGGSREIPFDARIVAATNRDLEAEVASKRFREDLFYRINVVTVEIPPLR